MNQILKLILMGVVLISFISCSSDPKQEDPEATEQPTETHAEVVPSNVDMHPLDAKSGLLSKRVIYFEFNEYKISDEDREFISAHAQYLSQNSGDSVVLEGHADERGTREYNLSLGEKRAKAVMQLIVVQGASSSQMKVISFGEERPAALGHDEDSWSQNRRVELVYEGH